MEDHSIHISENHFECFPEGACGDMSEILMEWLRSKGCKGIKYVHGERDGSRPHAWLEVNDIIIDITSDQFEDGLEPVYIGPYTNFHNSFSAKKQIDPEFMDELNDAFQRFDKLMENEPE